jgi:hypothetical protein
MPAAWALVPIKSFATAKSRLEGLLSRAECARLAEEMARDVLMALHAAPDITGIAILGDEPRLGPLATAVNATPTSKNRAGTTDRARPGHQGFRTTAHAICRRPRRPARFAGDAGAARPQIRRTICPAAEDGGTNARCSPAIPFLYGPTAPRGFSGPASTGVPVGGTSRPPGTWTAPRTAVAAGRRSPVHAGVAGNKRGPGLKAR